MRYSFEHKYILIAIITSIVGASARISYEKETKVIKRRRSIGYFTTAIFIGYILHEMLVYWDIEKATGFVCAIGGLLSIDIIKVLIEELPGIIKLWLQKKVNHDDRNAP